MIRQFRPIQDQARAILAKRRGVKVETIDLPAGWQHDLRRTYAM